MDAIMALCEHGNIAEFNDCRYCAIDKQAAKNYAAILNRINILHEHKNRQIDENRKISRRVDELQKRIEKLKTLTDIKQLEKILYDGAQLHLTIIKFETRMKELEQRLSICGDKVDKITSKPHRCPNCEGSGRYKLAIAQSPSDIIDCHSCKGTGIVWS
jgi:predicted RNase H-like nuclease (RuvC/YqgF family)